MTVAQISLPNKFYVNKDTDTSMTSLLEFIEYLKSIGAENCFLAGGALRCAVDGKEKIEDFDLFFRNKEDASRLEKKLIERFGSPVFKCPLGLLTTFKKDKVKVQLITEKIYYSGEELIATFDITAGKLYVDFLDLSQDNPFADPCVVTTLETIKDIHDKKVRLGNVTYPKATMKRVMKYNNKGYSVPNETIDKLISAVVSLSQTDPNFSSNEGPWRFYID